MTMNFRRQVGKRRFSFTLVSPGVTEQQIGKAFPNAKLARSWPHVRRRLVKRHGTDPITAAVYVCAPLQIPVDHFERETSFAVEERTGNAGCVMKLDTRVIALEAIMEVGKQRSLNYPLYSHQ